MTAEVIDAERVVEILEGIPAGGVVVQRGLYRSETIRLSSLLFRFLS